MRRQWHPTAVLLPGKSHGWRSLAGCSPWGREESDTTEQLHFHFSLSCIGEGNGNPLQCSCLENPRNGGAWWAALYGVVKSRTRLKWLSSSSSGKKWSSIPHYGLGYSWSSFDSFVKIRLQAHLGDVWVQFQTTDIKWVTGTFWFSTPYNSYVYTVVYWVGNTIVSKKKTTAYLNYC